MAKTTDSKPVNYIQIYVDGMKKYETPGGSLDVSLDNKIIPTGTHRLTVQASDGTIFKQTINITVQ